MRRARFAAAGEADEVRPPTLGELLRFDFVKWSDPDAAVVATERARSIAVSLPSLAAAHLFWGAVLLVALVRAGGAPLSPGLAVLAVLSADAALWALVRRGSAPRVVLLAALHTATAASLWAAAAWFALDGPGAGSFLVKAALVAGAGAAVAAFFAIPGLLVLSCAGALAVALLLPSETPVFAIGGGLSLFLVALGLARARDLILSARRRMAAERLAEKARRFVSDFEESGRGWFWETTAEGVLTYASGALARQLGEPAAALVGRRFEELLLVDSNKQGERESLGFHLSARFPFADVTVRAPGAAETWWSLSGSPNFDAYGRFLGFRGLGTNLTAERRSEAERTRLALYDSLTGLPNRAMMDDMIDEALSNAADRQRGCALMMIDLDKFKQVNDTLGHPVGDKLLKKVAARFARVVGEDGQVGRLGGDEFQTILPGMEEESRLSALASRIIEEVCRPYSIDGHRVVIGTSIGIAVARPGKAYAAAVVKEADLALYAAKAAGRGTFRFFSGDMHKEAAERQILAEDLRAALGRGQLRLLFQPIVESVSEEIVAFEALLRWQHPTRGLLLPDLILPLAEEAGLMPQIGDWVLRTACAEAAKWPSHVRIAVNLSPSQLADAALPATVTSALAASGLEPDRLELELTEAIFHTESGVGSRPLLSLKALGVRLSLDNFGTGEAGFGHLRDAPLDKIKIDRSFVCGAGQPGSRNSAIVRSIVVLAESLGMDTTAEGAETLEELSLIRRLGCSQVQGYLFGRPAPAAEALAAASQSRAPAEVIGFSRPPRHRILRTGTLHWDDHALPARLRNISRGGAMIECDRPIEPGTPVRLDLEEAGVVEAEVRWCQRGQVGMRFDREFELRTLARRAAPGAGPGVLTPAYLDPPSKTPPPARSPLARKPARR